jgi:cytochrome oxidase Cu insertion factor (SCO1/SenC/PrrC family)
VSDFPARRVRCCPRVAAAALVAFAVVAPAWGQTAPAKNPHAVHRAAPAPEAPQVLGPGYGSLDFEAPAPGTYRLPSLGGAADGAVVTADGRRTTLHELMDGHFVVLSFIYTRCPDPNGCPLATHVLRRLERRVAEAPALAPDVRFLTLSFDPAYDTPSIMADYRERAAQGRIDWRFLTAPSEAALDPILDAYDQSVIRSPGGPDGESTAFSHILRVYLIDRRQRIRNVYSVSFLHPDILIADLATLAGESG